MNLGRIVPVPSGLSLDSTLKSISALFHRHEVLRSRFYMDGRGTPFQSVGDCGELMVEEYEAAGADCRDVARTVKERISAVPFTAPEFPLRVALVTEQRRAAMLVLCAFHMATDAWGMKVIVDDLVSVMHAFRDGRGDPPSSPPTQVLERLEYEQSPQGVRRSEKSLDYWEKQLHLFPEHAVPAATHQPASAVFRELHMDSTALSAACGTLAHKGKVNVGAVFVGLVAELLCAMNENSGAGFLLFGHNRYGGKWARFSGPLVQNFPLQVTVAGKTFLEVARDIDQQSFKGSFFSQYDPAGLIDVISNAAEHLGFTPDLSLAMNTKLVRDSGSPTPETDTLPDTEPQDPEHLTAGSRISEGAGIHREDMNLYLSIDSKPDCAKILMRANTRIFSIGQMKNFLQDLEACALRNRMRP
ncbi:condensation domain-containing protein [Streptomyces sp. NBC_00280]|uniref:condensation domain-containing protein n=1 Tax=Streptomyces sp. NBC_00280 TaxID=2975699 RepID=UPI00324841DD